MRPKVARKGSGKPANARDRAASAPLASEPEVAGRFPGSVGETAPTVAGEPRSTHANGRNDWLLTVSKVPDARGSVDDERR